MQLVQGMYANVRSHVCVGEGFIEEFEVRVGVHQGSELSPSSLCLKPCHKNSALGSPESTSMSVTLLSLLNCFRNVSGDS